MGQKTSIPLLRAKKRLSNVTNASASPSQLQPIVWYANKYKYSTYLLQDISIRQFLQKQLAFAGIAQIVIRRYFRKVEISLFVSKPGIVIGKSGSNINDLKNQLVSKFGLPTDLKIEIYEFKDPFTSANIVAQQISESLKKGLPYRRVAKNFLDKIKYSGVLGAKIDLKGRLNGADIARKESFSFGSIPRHTIDANIDYSYINSQTKTGAIGVKVWIYNGDKIKNFTY